MSETLQTQIVSWVSIKNARPEVGTICLVCKSRDNIVYHVVLTEGVGGYYWAHYITGDFLTNIENISHWMLMPVLPKNK